MTEPAPMDAPACTADGDRTPVIEVTTRELDIAEGRVRWSDALDATFCELDVDLPRVGRAFAAEMTARPVADLALSVIRADPHTVVRSPMMIESDGGGDYLLCLVTHGAATLGQSGHTADLSGGSFGLVDASRPFVITGRTPFSQVVLRIPRPQLDSRATRSIIDSAMGSHIAADRGVGRLVSGLLMDLARTDHDDTYTVGSSAAVSAAVLDMIVTAVNDVTTPATAIDRAHAEDLRAVQRIMLTHIDDPDRTLSDVGTEAGMSVRYVHNLFGKIGATPRAWLARQRLERARTMLLQTSLGVADIGAQTGFKDPSHFSRAFRREFGASPAHYRTAAHKGVGR